MRFAKTKPSYAVQRYVGETERLYGVLDARLAGRQYVVGDKFTIADISLLGWANIATFSGIDIDQFPNVKAWLERVLERPAVKKGLAVPSGESNLSNAALARRVAEGDEDAKQLVEGAKKLIDEAKKEFGYKYASP